MDYNEAIPFNHSLSSSWTRKKNRNFSWTPDRGSASFRIGQPAVDKQMEGYLKDMSLAYALAVIFKKIIA